MKSFRCPLWLACAVLAAPALALPLIATSAGAQRDFELELTLEGAHLRAHNLGATPIALLFTSPSDARRAQLVIPAGATLETHFAPHVVRGLEFVVAGRNDCGPLRSVAFDLDTLRARSGGAVWFDLEHCGVSAWVRGERVFTGIDSFGLDNGEKAEPSNVSAPRHVPVITPQDGRLRQTPPRLERLSLPPV